MAPNTLPPPLGFESIFPVINPFLAEIGADGDSSQASSSLDSDLEPPMEEDLLADFFPVDSDLDSSSDDGDHSSQASTLPYPDFEVDNLSDDSGIEDLEFSSEVNPNLSAAGNSTLSFSISSEEGPIHHISIDVPDFYGNFDEEFSNFDEIVVLVFSAQSK